MKKHVLFSAAMVAAMSASAQTGEITSNRGENWLSQSGDWGLTFDAQPLLGYAGNLFNNGTNGMNSVWLLPNGGANSGGTPQTSGIVIGGKKLIDANTAYRGKVRIGFGSDKTTELVDDASNDDPDVTVEDVTKEGYMGITLGAGLEKRVGSTRVVGVYGGEFNVSLGSSKTTYEYGNALSEDFTNFGQERPTEEKNGSTFGIGLNAFAGVEWFCAPKISLSGEYTWGLSLSSTGLAETQSESWDGDSVETSTSEGNPEGDDKSSSFSLDTGVSGLSIGLNFYFQ